MKEQVIESNGLLRLIRGFLDMIHPQVSALQDEYTLAHVRAISPTTSSYQISNLVKTLRDQWLCFNYSEEYERNIKDLINTLQKKADEAHIYKPRFMVFVQATSARIDNLQRVVANFRDIAIVEAYKEEETFIDHIKSLDREISENRVALHAGTAQAVADSAAMAGWD